MNGARSVFIRKGYWLTALAAIVLLAASSGTAQAQLTPTTDAGYEGGVKVTVPKTVAEGSSSTITVSVKADVQADSTLDQRTVTVTLAVDADATGHSAEGQDTQFNPSGVATLIFPANNTPEDGVTPDPVTHTLTKSVSLQTTQDPDAEDEVVGLSVDVTDGLLSEVADKSIKIEDDETQTYVFKVTTEDPEEGMPIGVTLRADPVHVNDSVALTLHSDNPKYTAAVVDATPANTVTISNSTPQAGAVITVTPPGDDGNRVEDSFTLTAYSGSTGNSTEQASITIDVADAHALPAVAAMVVDKDGKALDPQPTSVAEGTSILVMVMPVDDKGEAIPAEEDLTVALTPAGTADAADYTLVGVLTIKATEDASNRVELEVRADEDVGMESLMFDAVVSGDSMTGTETSTSAAVLSLHIEDETAKKIEPKATEADYDVLKAAIAAAGGDDGVNPGDTVTLMTSDLFDVAPGYTASYGVSVAGDSASASASGESVTINALMAGEAKITVTGTARMASSSLIPSQTVSNVAELTFPVMVVDTELVVTLSAEPMEIEAGGTTMITATANRAVTVGDGAVEIALAVVPEGNGTLDPESIMIAMGEMSGSAMLTANESVTVVASGSGVTGLMQVAVTVTAAPEPEPEPVPALPLIAQWLLGLGLMGGGVRQLFRRRRQG